jgi:predicted protein tyrosine phosphatase
VENGYPGYSRHEIDFERGIRLHDPDALVLAETTGCSLVAESITESIAESITAALSLKLPAELVLDVLAYCSNEVDCKKKGSVERASESTVVDVWRRRRSFRFVLLFPTTEDELSKIHALLHNAINKHRREAMTTVITVRQDQHRVKSRRDLIEFMKEYRCLKADRPGDSTYLNLLLSAIIDTNIGSAKCSLVHQGRDGELLVTKFRLRRSSISSRRGRCPIRCNLSNISSKLSIHQISHFIIILRRGYRY